MTRRNYSYCHRVTVSARSERAARVLAALSLPAGDWSRAEVGEFSLVRASDEQFTLSIPVVVRAKDQDSARAFVESLLGIRGAKVEALRP